MTTINVNKITPGSGTSTALGESGDTFTIPAGVTFSNSGSSNLGDALSYCTTTKSASFTAVANKAYFVNTSDGTPFLNYATTVASGTLYVTGGTGNAYFLGGSRNMALTLLKGRTYRFTQSDNTNDGHPLIISTSNSGTLSTFIAGIVSSGVSYYLDGASNQTNYINTTPFNAATTRYIEFKPSATGTYYFGCYIHGIGMGGAITSQELTVTLPSSPAVGTEMLIIDSTGDASTNNIVIGRGGSKIKGACVDPKLKTDRVGVRLIYSDASQGWVTVTSANETAPTLNTTPDYIVATGGTITNSGDYRIHTFTGDANFVVSTAPTPGNNAVSYMVVAGGGGGGSNHGGGGGAGGFREGTLSTDPYAPNKSPLASTPLTVSVSTTYPISVGAGGNGATVPSPYAGATNGSTSTFSTISSAGGGRGGTRHDGSNSGYQNGQPGGSGGGGGGETATPAGSGGSGNQPPVSPAQGNNGASMASPYCGGGGGGATSAGTNIGGGNAGGAGGNGAGTAINPAVGTSGPSGSLKYFAGGGGAGRNPSSANGGYGGGGSGYPYATPGNNAFKGTANTGGGGGVIYGCGLAANQAGTGGSGVVVIRYKYQ